MLIDIEKVLYDLIVLARAKENAPDWALGLKLVEEVGEVSEVILYENGFIQHKEIKEDLFHEVADVFNVCTAILTQHYTELDEAQIMVRLTQAVEKKGKKYADLLNDGMNQ
jgi:NTP pyrophosphatase (non-canonical NTP hydrolase)